MIIRKQLKISRSPNSKKRFWKDHFQPDLMHALNAATVGPKIVLLLLSGTVHQAIERQSRLRNCEMIAPASLIILRAVASAQVT